MKMRYFPGGIFLLGLICFVLPFTNLTCNGEAVARFSGINMVTGSKIVPLKKEDRIKYEEEKKQAKSADKKNENLPPQSEMIIAFGLLFVAAISTIYKRNKTILAFAAVAGFVTCALFVEYKYRMAGFDNTSKLTEFFGLRFLYGYWLSAGFAFCGAIASLYLLVKKLKKHQNNYNLADDGEVITVK